MTVQANQAGWGVMEQEVHSYKGPPSLALTEHWNYDDNKDFHGGHCYMNQGPLPQLWANTQFSARPLWGEGLMSEMERHNHTVGLKVVGEMLPQERNAVTLAEDRDQYGLPIARLTYSWCDNDRQLARHSLDFMDQALQAVNARDIRPSPAAPATVSGAWPGAASCRPTDSAGAGQRHGGALHCTPSVCRAMTRTP